MFFDENEAFIALTSVSSFVHLLLKQIQEKIAFNLQNKKLKETKISKHTLDKSLNKNKKPLDKLIDLIELFVKSNGEYIYNTKNIKEFEIIGLFHAYIQSISPNITIQREPRIKKDNIIIEPDFIITIDKTDIILEFRRQLNKNINKESLNQMSMYMLHTGIDKGLIYYPYFTEPNPKILMPERQFYFSDTKNQETVIISS